MPYVVYYGICDGQCCSFVTIWRRGENKKVTDMEGGYNGRISVVAPRRIVFAEIRMGECTFG